MRRLSIYLGSVATLVAVSLLSLSGCSGVDCGEGTVEQDGECVLEAEALQCETGEVVVNGSCEPASSLCDEGTSFDQGTGTCVADEVEPGDELTCGANTTEQDGECVAEEAVECGASTQLDPNTNTCEVTNEVCGENTAFSGDLGACVPTDEVCDEGTHFSEETGLCMPESSCRPGDVVLDGFCVPEAEELAANAEYIADGNTDPAFDGTPVDVELADMGESSIFAGTIDGPSDLNDDGDLNQHVDYFRFNAEAGDWFEISVRSTGIPSPIFTVYSEEADEHFLYRASASGTTRDKMRQVVIPEDGSYFITVRPEASYMTSYALGGEDWDYVGTLEHIETPEAMDHTFEDEALAGTLGRLDDNFVAIDEFNEGDQVEFSWDHEPGDADQILSFWASPTEFIGEESGGMAGVTVPEGDMLYAIADWDRAYGFDLDYEISAESFVDFEDGDEIEVTFSASDSDVLEIRQSNADAADVNVTVWDDQDMEWIETTALGSGPNDFIRYVGVPEGDYTVVIENDSGDTIEEFTQSVDVISPTMIDDPTQTIVGEDVDELDGGEQDWYWIELEDEATYRMTLTHTDGAGWGRLFHYAGLGDELLERMDPDVRSSSPTNSITATLEADTAYILRVGGDETTDFPYDYELDFTEVFELDAGDTVEETVDADAGDVLEVSHENDDNIDAYVTVMNSSDDVVAEQSLPTGEVMRYVGLDEDTYTVTIENTSGDTLTGFSHDVHVISPVEATDFTAEEGDLIRLSQDNADDASVFLVVTDEDGEIVGYEWISTSDHWTITAPADGEHTVWYFQSGVEQAEQELDEFEVTVEFATVDWVDDFDADVGNVVEITQTNTDDESVNVWVDHASSGEVILDSMLDVEGSDVLRHVGVSEAGTYNISLYSFDEEFDSADFTVDADVIPPTEITDTDAVYSGSANEADVGEQSYYWVEFSETTEYTVTGDVTGGSGWVRLFIYGLGSDVLEMTGENSSSVSTTFTFEADTLYLIRVGNNATSFSGDFDYDLSFEDPPMQLEDGDSIDDTVEGQVGDVLYLRQTNTAEADFDVMVTDPAGDPVIDEELGSGDQLRYVGLEEAGTYSVSFWNNSGDTVGVENLDWELVSPTEIDDLTATYSGSATEADDGDQSYYWLELPQTMEYTVSADITSGGFEWVKLFIYGAGNDLITDAGGSSDSASTTFTFEADTLYLIRVGNDSSTFSGDFDYDLTFEEVQ